MPASTASAHDDPARDDATPLRVLVTGFNDWKELGEPPNVWRCRDNPSCRLLLGDATDDKPSEYDGPLAQRLRAVDLGRPIVWSFATLPVTWEVAKDDAAYQAHDVVVHLGLGVYDRTDTVYVEDGAFNRRQGKDAAGRPMDEPISADVAGNVLAAPDDTGIAQKVRAINDRSFAGLHVQTLAARDSNSYLCNETHFWALTAVEASAAAGGRLKQAFFVHIPYAAQDDYNTLADGIAQIVTTLVS